VDPATPRNIDFVALHVCEPHIPRVKMSAIHLELLEWSREGLVPPGGIWRYRP
jgi:hypothetical protein